MPLPNALRFLAQWIIKKQNKTKKPSPNHCCLETRISQSYLSRLGWKNIKVFPFLLSTVLKRRNTDFLFTALIRAVYSGSSPSVLRLVCQEESHPLSYLYKLDRHVYLSWSEVLSLFLENSNCKLFSWIQNNTVNRWNASGAVMLSLRKHMFPLNIQRYLEHIVKNRSIANGFPHAEVRMQLLVR